MKITRRQIKQIIKEELNAIIGEGAMSNLAVEIMNELQLLMSKFNIDIGGLRGILGDMEADDGDWYELRHQMDQELGEPEPEREREPLKEDEEAGKVGRHDWLAMATRDEDDNSMIGRVANAILQELIADTHLSEEEAKMHLEEIRGFAQEYIMPIYNQIQTHGMDKV
jgi:hypothetical protein